MKKIGILGGMGPLAGVELQRYIIEATPAKKDQDHLEVVCYTASQVPDRSASLAADGGKAYLRAVVEAAQLLVKAGVSVMAIPCNTAHSRLPEIQAEVAVPIVNMVQLAVERLLRDYHGMSVGLLATDGTIASRVYEKTIPHSGIRWVLPRRDEQKAVMETIYSIKAKGIDSTSLYHLKRITRNLIEEGVGVLVAGCTELSLVTNKIQEEGKPVVDPMRVLAEALVEIGRK